MAFGMISGTVGAAPGSAITIGTNQAGGLTQMNVAMIGGIMTGSNNQFSSLPVAGASDALGMPANAEGSNGTLVLSSSFAGYSGSIIQALNHLKALQAADAGGDVSGPASSTDNAVARFDSTGGKTLLNSGVIIGDSNGVSGVASLSISDAGTIGPASVTDLITLSSDGDLTFKDGTHDLNVASHDGTNGLALAGTIVTATAANLNLNTGVTAGTAIASRVVSLDGSKDVAGLRNLSSEGIVLAASSLSGTALSIGGGDFLVNVDGQVSAPLANFTTQVGTATLVASSVVSGTTLSVGGGDFAVDVDGLAVGSTIMATTMLSGTGLSVGGGDFSVNVDGNIVGLGANLSSGGITNAGAIAGATSVDGNGDLTMGTITMTGFSVDADGDTALKSLAVDNSSTIGCDADADIMTLANQSLALANDVDFNVAKTGGLQLGGSPVTSTAAELNLLDTAAANTVVNSKAVIYGSSGEVAATTVSGTSNISANAFIMAGTNAAGAAKLFKLSVDGGIMLVSEAGTP